MKNVIQITDKILGVIVPENSDGSDIVYPPNGVQVRGITENGCWHYTDLPFGKYKIHGTCTLPAFEFDFEVDESWVDSKWFIRLKFYKDYIKSKNHATTKEESFRTRIQNAIQDEGLFFVNPIPQPEVQGGYTPDGCFVGGYDDKWVEQWQSAEYKTVKKLLLIEKI